MTDVLLDLQRGSTCPQRTGDPERPRTFLHAPRHTPDGRLFITTAGYGLRPPTLHDGALFAVDVNIPGRPANEYVPADS